MARRSARVLSAAALLAACGALPGWAAPVSNPAVARFAVGGITVGMTLPQAVAAMRETFTIEGLADTHIMTASSKPLGNGQVVRLAIAQQASTAATQTVAYREDRFKLRLAGPPAAPVVTSLTRDYLAPDGLQRATVLHELMRRYGRPTSANVPDAAVAPNAAQLIWVISPGGGLAGGGVQSSTDLRCGMALTQYDDYFDASAGSNGELVQLVQTHHAGGCGLVLQVDFSYNAVHYQMYDTGTAVWALGSAGKVAPAKAVPVKAVPASAIAGKTSGQAVLRY